MRVRLLTQETFEGELLEVSEEQIVLAAEKKEKKKKVIEEKSFAFSDIEKANVLVSFK